ncbi:MAG TPA: tetratricopeptide repeat protein [Bryobacteraceae bacterium]|nr:tetratricopeptide repeat protein [Bryobacteraceae bacterium]
MEPMGFWRKEVIDPALDHETARHIREQLEWIAREPANARPYYHLAQLYRVQGKQDEALALLLEAVCLDASLAPAHVALAEIYAVRADYPAAWRHARAAQQHGDPQAVALLSRHGICESTGS